MAEPVSKCPTGAPLERREHTDFEGIPYYDEDLRVPQSYAHQRCIYELGPILAAVAHEAGLVFLSDHPIWSRHPETDEQKCYYGDFVLLRQTDIKRVTVEDVLVSVEVVTTSERRKEIKDTVFQRAVAEYNGVVEFGLIFPDLADPRSLSWFVLDTTTGRYRETALSSGGQVHSRAVPQLTLRVLPRDRWQEGRKIEVVYRGEVRGGLEAERQRAEALARRLRDLGADPDTD